MSVKIQEKQLKWSDSESDQPSQVGDVWKLIKRMPRFVPVLKVESSQVKENWCCKTERIDTIPALRHALEPAFHNH